MTTTAAPLSPADIEVARDRYDRGVVLLPDAWAARLSTASRTGWVERGFNDGESRTYDAGTAEFSAARLILDAVAAAPPDLLPAPRSGPPDQQQARRGSFYGAVVGHTAWNRQQRWWAFPVTSPEHHRLVCSHSLHLLRGRVQWTG